MGIGASTDSFIWSKMTCARIWDAAAAVACAEAFVGLFDGGRGVQAASNSDAWDASRITRRARTLASDHTLNWIFKDSISLTISRAFVLADASASPSIPILAIPILAMPILVRHASTDDWAASRNLITSLLADISTESRFDMLLRSINSVTSSTALISSTTPLLEGIEQSSRDAITTLFQPGFSVVPPEVIP